MKSKLVVVFAAIILLSTMFINTNVKAVSYAEPGTMMSNAIKITLGNSYTKTWYRSSDHLYCYNEITISERGILKMTFSKPTDSEGEYGRLKVAVYDVEGELIWDTISRNSVETASPDFKYYIGLDKGTYYVAITPGFTVLSGGITTNYSFTFTPDKYSEVEPNENPKQATNLELGHMYNGYFGNEYGERGDFDYYKAYLTKGIKYRILFENINISSIVVDLKTPDGQSNFISYDMKIDNEGNQYYEFTATSTGNHFICISNYSQMQIPYKIGVFDMINGNKTTKKGDINGDGKVNTQDARQALLHYIGKTKLTEEQKKVADINKDGKINTQDARQILLFYIGKINTL